MNLPLFGRREVLRIGTIALGGFWLGPAGRVSAALPARAAACILLYMDGGPSHIDLWDLKPEAPAEFRGEFRPIATSVPGIRVCEHLPLTARQVHRLAQVRSVRRTETVHDPAVYQMLTGRKHVSSAGDLTVQPTDAPQMGTAFGGVDRRPGSHTPRHRAARDHEDGRPGPAGPECRLPRRGLRPVPGNRHGRG